MKENLSSPPVNDASAAVATWRQVVQSPAAVGLFLAVLIVLLAWPRLTGPPWQALWMPFDLRESEGNTLTWEQIYYFNALRATLESDAGSVLGSYSTDHYRSMLPIYISSIFARWLDSSYKGFALVDLLGWWLSAWSLYYLARRLDADRTSALIAAVLLISSPLMAGFMWNQNLHVIQSASLVPCFLAALLLHTDERLDFGWYIVGIASVLYVASVICQYQWIIAPFVVSIIVMERRRLEKLLAIVAAVVLFLAMTLLTHQLLASTSLSVSSLANDPLVVVSSRIAHLLDDVPRLGSSLLEVAILLVGSYHPYIVFLSVLGVIFANTKLRILICFGTMLGLASGYLHPVHWVVMHGYPFMYISAALALTQGPCRLTDVVVRISRGRYPQLAEQINSESRILTGLSTAMLILLAVWITNTDIFDDYSFAQQWLGDSRW